MIKSKTRTVTAAPGRVVPIHPSTASGTGDRQLRITDRDVVTLPNDSFVRRRILSGDLIETNEAKKLAETADAKHTSSKKKES